MADVDLSAISSDGQALPSLAPDLNWLSNQVNSAYTYQVITGINGSSGYATALSASSGPYAISLLQFASMTNENFDVRLTIDDELIIDDSVTVTAGVLAILGPLGTLSLTAPAYEGAYKVNSSILLEIQSTTDTNISLNHNLRKIK